MSSNNQEQTYFAAREAKDCADILLGKAQTFYKTMESNAFLDKLQSSWRYYHGAFATNSGYGHSIGFAGEQGELVQLPVNHYRNLAQHMLNMITANRPVMEARAINTDYKSQAQTYLANGILDYYMREKHLETALKKAVEMSIIMGSGFIKLDWNATAGEAYDFDEETQSFNYEGEIEFTNLSQFDVVVDGTKESWNHDWTLVRTWQNRFNLMAKYPELADKIRGIPTKDNASIYRLASFSNDDTDDIAVYEFFHKRTEAIPEGRYLLFLDGDVVLMDAKMPYRVIPVFRVVAGEFLGTPYGYTPMFDVFPLQEGINSLFSTILTNQNAFGVQNIFVKRGSDIAINSLEGALNIIEGNEAPVPINLTQTPKEVFEFLNMLIQNAETISGINSVARGNPEANLRSGNAMALIQSMALQFMSGLQQSYVQLVEDVGSALIQILKDFATAPKVIALVGKNNRALLKEFTGEDIEAINRVVVDVGNPLSRTTAGRVQMAEQMLQMKLIKQPEQYFQVMNTGRLDVVFEAEMSQLLLIQSENEQLSSGRQIIASPLDRHRLHISEHSTVLNDPDIRKDSELVSKVMDHIEEHLNFLRNTDPDLLSLIGETALPPLNMAPPGGTPQMAIPPPNAQPNLGQPLPSGPGPGPSGGQGKPNIQLAGGGHQNIPNPAVPPKPFENLPTNPQDVPGR